MECTKMKGHGRAFSFLPAHAIHRIYKTLRKGNPLPGKFVAIREKRLTPFIIFCAVWALCPRLPAAQSAGSKNSAHLAKANQAYQSQDWPAAAAEYQAAIQLDPANASAYARLGIAYQRLGRLESSARSLEKALKLKPGMPDVDVLLAFVDIRLRQYQKAIPLLRQAVSSTHDDLPLRLAGGERLVDLYFMQGEDDEGIKTVQELRRLAPDDPDVLYTASRAYSSVWKNVVERLYAKDPNSYRTHQVLAEAAAAKGDDAEAAKEYRIVVKMAPQLPGAHYQLGRMILQSERTAQGSQKARNEFLEELKIDPNDAPSDEQIGELDLEQHSLDGAKMRFAKAVQLDPSYVDAHLGLGKVFLQMKQFSNAGDQFEQATRLAPDNPTAFYELMIADRALGRSNEASAALASFERLRKQAALKESYTLKELQAPLVTQPADHSLRHP